MNHDSEDISCVTWSRAREGKLKHGVLVTELVCMIALSAFMLVGMSAAGDMSVGDVMNSSDGKAAKTLVVIGASYAGGWKPQKPVAGFQVVNKGVSGQQSFEMLARFEMDVVAPKPDAVMIWGFINDIFRADRQNIEPTLKRTRESILAMVAMAKQAGITPILATEITIREKDGWSESLQVLMGRVLGKPSYQDYVNGHVKDTNRWIRELAAREGILLLDLETALADQHGIRRKEFSRPDGSHISPQGYEAITPYVEERIKKWQETDE